MRAARSSGTLAFAFLLSSLVSCGARESTVLPALGQVVLYVDTDAPLPPEPGETPEADAPRPLFDSLRVDVFEPERTEPCDGCTRTFAVTAGRMKRRDVSFGIPTRPGVVGYRVRVRLYWSRSTLTGEVPVFADDGSPPPSVIDATVSLPPVSVEGIVERTVMLPTDSVGMPIGTLESPTETLSGRPATSVVGTWPRARRVPCVGEAREGEVCIPGGAFWMGNAQVTGSFILDAADRLRLVVLSPYFFDTDEMSVGRMRATGSAPDEVWSGGSTGDLWTDFCTFTPKPGPNEDYPVNCISDSRAQKFCNDHGGDLPTEAQFEFVASAFDGRLFVWGEDSPSCDDAVLERGGWGSVVGSLFPVCKPATPPGGPLPIGSRVSPPRRDRIVVGDRTVYDLVGNLAEYTADIWNRQSEACWSHGGVYFDPLCTEKSPTDGPRRSMRGGSWFQSPELSTAAYRAYILPNTAVNGMGRGFRCARPAVGK